MTTQSYIFNTYRPRRLSSENIATIKEPENVKPEGPITAEVKTKINRDNL